MNAKLKKTVAIGAATILCCIFTGCKGGKAISSANQLQKTETHETSDVKLPEHTITGDIANKNTSTKNSFIELTKIIAKEPNNTDKNGYKEYIRPDGISNYELYKESIQAENLVPFGNENNENYTLNTGHTIYVRELESSEITDEESDTPVNTSSTTESDDNEILEEANTDNLQKCIVSGEEVYDIDNYTYEIKYPNSFAQLRKEESCERIYIYNSKEDYDQAIKNRDDGQAILNGEKEPYANCVILNGSLVPNLKYSVNDDGRLCVSLRSLATAYDANTNYDEDAHLLTVPITYGHYILIPSKNALPNISDYFNIDNKNNTFKYPSIAFAPFWSDTFTLATTDDVIMPVEDISRILGWDFWYGDNVLKVITDELDDTNPDNFVLEEKQSNTIYYELDELDGYDESESEADAQ